MLKQQYPTVRRLAVLGGLTLWIIALLFFGAALGLAPYTAYAVSQSALWHFFDTTNPFVVIALVFQAGFGIALQEYVLFPYIVYPLWREIDRGILAPLRRARASRARGGII